MLIRFLFDFALPLFLVWLLWQKIQLGRRPARRPPPHRPEAEDMVACAHCGVYLPKSESILDNGNRFCSQAHRQLHRPR